MNMKALISTYENNRVAQVAETEFPVADGLFWIDCPDDCAADTWLYVDGVLSPKPAPAPTVPQSVSPRQIRMALTRAGLREAVEAAVLAGDQDLKDWWEFSTSFERNNPQVEVMATVLGVSTQQLDDLWSLAASL